MDNEIRNFSLKNWVGRAMGNETFSRAGLTARQKQNAFQSFTSKKAPWAF